MRLINDQGIKGTGPVPLIFVHPGQSLAHIIHPYNGQILSDVKATKEGTVLFAHNRPVVLQNALLFMVHTIEL